MRDLKKSTNSLETRRIRKILNEEARLGISPNSDSDTEEVDLSKELYPLGHYINNREEMIEQMFSIIKGAKLKKMLPPILKDMPFDELKADCLIHLLGMSKKRIRAILDGREINSSSDSETHSDSSTTSKKRPKVDLKPFVIKQEGCSDISDNSEEVVLVDPDLDFLNVTCTDKKENSGKDKVKSKRKMKRKDLNEKHKRVKTKVVEQDSESDSIEQIDTSAESAAENEADPEAPKGGKTLLEILELEMRARAIRALLKTNDAPEGEPNKCVEDSTNLKQKTNKHLKEDTTKKITPVKNFRKKKRKNDDVIVIAPKVVTIDLTDENEQGGVKNDNSDIIAENAPSSTQNNSMEAMSSEKPTSEKLVSDLHNTNESNKSTVDEEEISKSKELSSEMVASCSVEDTSKTDSTKPTHSENSKSSWAQRWLDSNEVKKVVSTSKICGNIRKKIKSAKLAKQQKQSQDEPAKPSISLQQVEGSVVEYELLSKSKVAVNNVVKVNDDETQLKVSSENQEPTSLETALIEASTADQVQDVSSTKAENSSATSGTSQDIIGLQANEESNIIVEIKPNGSDGATHKSDLQDDLTSKNTSQDKGENVEGDGEVEVSKLKHPIKNDQMSLENICSSTEIRSEEENTRLHETKSENVDENSYTNDGNDEKHCESSIELVTDPGLSNSENEFDSTSNGEIVKETNSQNLNCLQIKNGSLQNDEGSLEESETMITKISSCVTGTKPFKEMESEALEINITEEDRYIEDVAEDNDEHNQPNIEKDNVIIID